MDIAGLLYTASTWIIPVLIAITFHEAAHAFAAWKLGDNTALAQGRVTFNPLKHVDPFGTILLPALLLIMRAPFLFGWAKPVPVNFAALRNPRLGMILVAAVGPAINLALAVASALLFHLLWLVPEAGAQWAARMLSNSIILNLVLAVFNMLPLPPLDGGRVVAGLLPPALGRAFSLLEPYGLLILIGVIFILPMLGRQAGIDLNVFQWLVWSPVAWMLPFFKGLAGVG